MTQRFQRRARRPTLQMQLALPPVPRESPLRAAFRRADLARLGIDFRAALGNPRGARLLRGMAGALERGNDLAARAYKRQLESMRRLLR